MSSSVTSAPLKLLDLTLKSSGAIVRSVVGEFSASGVHEIVVLRAGGRIELYAVEQTENNNSNSSNAPGSDDDDDDDDEPRTTLRLVERLETRSVLRALVAVRVDGERRDAVVVGDDSGRLCVIDLAGGVAKVLHNPSYGNTGCRRGTPGQYVAADPRGRAVLVGAVERRRLVYVLNVDDEGRPTVLASPLEAHRPRTITFDVVGTDNGYGNPVFAALERRYPEFGEEHESPDEDSRKELAYYELNLGLNHVSRAWAAPVHASACVLAAVPGGQDAPGGVLVAGEDWIQYRHSGCDDVTIVAPLPRRKLQPADKGLLVQNLAVFRQRKRGFFALAQTEVGDVYKVTLKTDKQNRRRVVGMTIALLDTLPVANSLNITRLGMLFVAAEFGDHGLYRFVDIKCEDAPTTTDADVKETLLKHAGRSDAASVTDDDVVSFLSAVPAASLTATFSPTPLRRLRRVLSLPSLAPTTGLLVGELAGGEVSPQIYAPCGGGGDGGSLRVLRHGAAARELAVSDLPGTPGAVATVGDPSGAGDGRDRFVLVSFADATLVLSVSDRVEEVGEGSGFATTAPTLACAALDGGRGVVQVHPGGVRHVRRVGERPRQWDCPGLKRIETATANGAQVVVSLAGGELIYFESDPLSGNLVEAASSTKDDLDVCCLDVGAVPEGRTKSRWVAVGCRDQTVRILDLEAPNLLVQKGRVALESRVHDVCLQRRPAAVASEHDDDDRREDTVLTVGMEDGSAVRATVDPATGSVSASLSRRFLGARPVKVVRVKDSTLLLSSRPWISRPSRRTAGAVVTAPLSYAPLDHACRFSSDAVPEGIVATAGSTLRILSVVDGATDDAGNAVVEDDDAVVFHQRVVPLRYTPRQMCLVGNGQRMATVEADHNEYTAEEKRTMGVDPETGETRKGGLAAANNNNNNNSGDPGKDGAAANKDGEDEMDIDDDDDDDDENNDEKDKDKENQKDNEGKTDADAANNNNNDDDGGDKKNEEKKDDDDASSSEDEEDKEATRTVIRGPVPAAPGHWASCVRLLDPTDDCRTLDLVELPPNVAALCCCSVVFHSRGDEALLAVGTVTNLTLHPLKHEEAHISLYRVADGDRLRLLHRTKVEKMVLAMVHFQGRLLVGVGDTLRLYEMGRKQLLRKCELRSLPTLVRTLHAAGDRAYVGDLAHSVHLVRHDAARNVLVLVAADRTSRRVVCCELLDASTVAVADKFGNVAVLRLPRGADAAAVDVSGARALWECGATDPTPRTETLCHYHVGEVVTGMTRASLVAGGAEALFYVTVTGRIGALTPFSTRDDADLYGRLEARMRTEAPRPTGREPQAYRSYYAPVKHVVDGDLCDAYARLDREAQTRVAEALDRTVEEVLKKLEDTRNALL